MGAGDPSWAAVLTRAEVRAPAVSAALLPILDKCLKLGEPPISVDPARLRSSGFQRVLALCPCLYAQISTQISARGVAHLCEITLGTRINSDNVHDAFLVQHPSKPLYAYPPATEGARGGDVMEALCGEVLANHGVPHMRLGADDWPLWASPAHVSLNKGRFSKLKLYGDFLIPAAPHNILISVKSEAAKERLVVSGNRLESVGFGFFKSPEEFWSESRMNLLKRWGFVAIYMPQATFSAVDRELKTKGRESFATNINGRPLYRPLNEFGPDMNRIAGKISFAL